MSNAYKDKQCYVVVDEAHCILEWGDNFHPIFKEIKQLRAVIPESNVLALSATLSTASQKETMKLLLMKQVKCIDHPPAKENISIVLVERPAISCKNATEQCYSYIFQSLYMELLQKKQDFPLAVVYFNGNMDWVGYGYEMAKRLLG